MRMLVIVSAAALLAVQTGLAPPAAAGPGAQVPRYGAPSYGYGRQVPRYRQRFRPPVYRAPVYRAPIYTPPPVERYDRDAERRREFNRGRAYERNQNTRSNDLVPRRDKLGSDNLRIGP